jgi:YgiT-type zinc finger domain-containing protein
MTSRRCPSCGKTALFRGTTTVEQTYPAAGGKVRAVVERVPAVVCRGCGESMVAGEDLGRAELIASGTVIDAGVRSGALLSSTRRSLGLLATDLAALLGVTAETISRWENDKVAPEPAIWNVVAGLVEDRLEGRTRTQDRLRTAARRPGREPVLARFEPETRGQRALRAIRGRERVALPKSAAELLREVRGERERGHGRVTGP